MRLTPIDIRKQQFRRGLRGYDVDEVDTFMAMVADEMEDLITTAQKSKTELANLKERLSEYQQMESTMRETLVTVQKAAEEKRDSARREADLIIKEAEVQASNWIEDAHRSVREVKKELAKLGGMRDSYITRLKMLMQAQLDMIKMLEKDDEDPEESLDMFEERLNALRSGPDRGTGAPSGGLAEPRAEAADAPDPESVPQAQSEDSESLMGLDP